MEIENSPHSYGRNFTVWSRPNSQHIGLACDANIDVWLADYLRGYNNDIYTHMYTIYQTYNLDWIIALKQDFLNWTMWCNKIYLINQWFIRDVHCKETQN